MKPTKGPYSFAGQEAVVIDGVEHAAAQVMRENSGALVIMAPDPDGPEAASDRMRIGTVDLVTFHPKRGEGWRATFEDDPVQAANARLFRESWALLELARDLCAAVDDGTLDHECGSIYVRAAKLIETVEQGR